MHVLNEAEFERDLRGQSNRLAILLSQSVQQIERIPRWQHKPNLVKWHRRCSLALSALKPPDNHVYQRIRAELAELESAC